MSDEPSAWDAAVLRFTEGYGAGQPDFNDSVDRVAFAALFEDEVRRRISTENLGLGEITMRTSIYLTQGIPEVAQ